MPANHPLFTERTYADVRVEMLEDLAVRRRELQAQLDAADDDGLSPEARLLRSIREIDRVFGDVEEVEDPLWDRWERQLEAGELPDM